MTEQTTPRHGVIDYDDQEEWLVESDAEGASRIIARDVPRWFGLLVVQTLGAPSVVEDPYRELDPDEEAAEAATWD